MKDTKYLPLIFIILVVIKTAIALVFFNFKYTDIDQIIYWNGALDYANGVFHEPYFYGQNYGIMLEAFLAVPFIKLHMPVHIALPLVTAFMAVFPYLFWGIYLSKHNKMLSGLIVLAIPLLLPISYTMLGSMPRGFIQGFFTCSLLIIPLLNPSSTKSIVGSLTISAISILLNPSSVLICAPICLYIWFLNSRSYLFYIYSLLMATVLWAIFHLLGQYYSIHPEALVFKQIDITFSFNNIVIAFTKLDSFFKFLCPIVPIDWFLPIAILILGIVLIKKGLIKEGYVVIASVLLIIVSFGVSKTHNSFGGFHHQSSRMYLGIPLILAFPFIWLEDKIQKTKAIPALLAFIVINFTFTIINVRGISVKHGNEQTVPSISIENLANNCLELETIKKAVKADIVLVKSNGLLAYASNIMNKSNSNVLLSNYERRSWLTENAKHKIYSKIMLEGFSLKDLKVKPLKELKTKNTTYYFIENNLLPLDSLYIKIPLF